MGIPFPISDLAICPGNCSGNGICLSGACLCQIKYAGWSCNERNFGYYLSFGVIFYTVCFTAIIQLILCIRSDFRKLKRPSIIRACRPNIQKLIYITVICATGSRSVYFILGLYDLVPQPWKEDLFPLFYTFVLSGISCLICFWAESFHLSGVKFDGPRLLTKSYCAFVGFNIFIYSLAAAKVVTNHALPMPVVSKLTELFNGCLAFLMFFALVFFLIYGVEIFCKVEGAFNSIENTHVKHINLQQLFQSRLGLVASASLQLAVTMFLTWEVLGKMWKNKMSIGDRNIMEIAFHIAELGCVLWFPCCLWNVSRPGELWILNPKKLLLIGQNKEKASLVRETPPPSNYNTFDSYNESQDADEIDQTGDCWICYDNENTDRLIRPCSCKGGMEFVHHDCLKKWLLERPNAGNGNTGICCNICKTEYNVTHNHSIIWIPNMVQIQAWSQTFFVIVAMASFPVILFYVWPKIHLVPVRVLCMGLTIIGEYLLLRLLGFNFLKAYKITKTLSLKILGRKDSAANTVSFGSSHMAVAVET